MAGDALEEVDVDLEQEEEQMVDLKSDLQSTKEKLTQYNLQMHNILNIDLPNLTKERLSINNSKYAILPTSVFYFSKISKNYSY